MTIPSNKNIVFDTMFYRKMGAFLKNASSEKRVTVQNELFNKEKTFLLQPQLSVLVALELLKHLRNQSDTAFSICKIGLLFALKHTENRLLLPPEMYFSEKFFKVSEHFTPFMDKLKMVLSEIEKTEGDDKILKKLNADIKWLTGKFYDMIEHTLFDFPKGDTPKNEPASSSKKREKKSLHINLFQKEAEYESMATAFLDSLALKLNIENLSEKDLTINYLVKNHRASFEKFRQMKIKIFNEVLSIKKQPNDVSDALIMMALNPAENTVFVTQEKANIRIIHKVGLKDWVISQEDYFKMMGI